MVYVVKNDEIGTILNRCDAWEADADLKMEAWARKEGYTILKAEITAMGDMVIWVE